MTALANMSLFVKILNCGTAFAVEIVLMMDGGEMNDVFIENLGLCNS
jgi:hypothetical protein